MNASQSPHSAYILVSGTPPSVVLLNSEYVHYRSSSLPQGYDTILGYFSFYHPSAFAMMFDPVEELRYDEGLVAAQAGSSYITVDASPFEQQHGILRVRAYPSHVIEEVMDAALAG